MYDGGPIATRLRSVGDIPAEFTEEISAWPPPRRPGAARLSEALVLTALSAVLPGLAHLRARRVRTGTILLVSYALGLTAAVVAAGGHHTALLELAVRPGWLAVLAVGAVLLAGLWALVLISSYAVLRPARLSPGAQLLGGTLVAVMCLLVVVPPLTLARYGYLQRDLVNSVFVEEPAGAAPVASRPTANPWAGLPRLNILLLGGDADVSRPGVRTDSMTVASIDTRSGDTVLLSLPRNLQRVPVWTGRERLAFPAQGLLNSVYQHGVAHPRAVGARVRNPGAELLKRTAGHILGLPVHHYGMVDMRSFRQIVDAIGGVRICVDHNVPVPREQVPAGVLRAGCRELSGREALWYGRSRTGSSDYSRMSRQKCLMWAIARQASPLTVLRSFQRLSQVFKYSVNTDLPRSLLPPLIALSGKVRAAQISSIQFVPPLVATGSPDLIAIRRLAGQAISRSGAAHGDLAALHILGRTCT